jgi:hypothetical protein
MKNDDLFFSIFNYINSKLEEKTQNENRVIVSINEDNKEEPYIDITYIDAENSLEASMTNDVENLSDMAIESGLIDVFDTYCHDAVVSVVYDTGTNKLNLLRMRNGNYVGDKSYDDFETPIFVGYIVKSGVLTRQEKILVLYEVMKSIMDAAYTEDLEEQVFFKVKEEPLNNIYYERTFKEESTGNYNLEELDNGNIAVIENEFTVKLIGDGNQKVKK